MRGNKDLPTISQIVNFDYRYDRRFCEKRFRYALGSNVINSLNVRKGQTPQLRR